MAILGGHAGFWGLYPVLAALGLAGCSVGIGLAVLLVRACGVGAARRRLFMMNMALLGVLALALAGWRLWIGPAIESAAGDPHLQEVLATLVSPEHWMWMPARAALGDPGGIVLLSAGALFLFRLLGVTMADQYVAGMLASRAGATGPRPRSADAEAGLGRFPIAAKEWLLIRRSPVLFLQALFQSAALGLLLAFFLRRDGAGSIEAQVEALLPAAAVVFLAALTARVAWLIVSAEEAPALLAACPQAPHTIRLQKMGVAFVVTLAPALLLCAWFATRGLAGAVWLLCMAILGNGSLAAMHAWNAGTGTRRDVVRRGKSMPLVLRMVEGTTVAAWGAATYGVPHAAWWGFPTLALAIVLPLVSSFHGAHKQQEGAY
jgi:ABC-2 type transport system permease protein